MTTAASSGTANVTGYAIPIAKVTAVADDLEQGVTSAKYVYGTSAFLGIGLGNSGTTVGEVYDGTAAARAGLVAGDVITRIDDTRTPTAAALTQTIHTYKVGDQVTVGWTDTAGGTHSATVTLGNGPVA
jgi:S1-C subfamily serine protease